METSVAEDTSTFLVPVTPLMVAVRDAEPTPVAVTFPLAELLFTEITFESLEAQATLPVRF